MTTRLRLPIAIALTIVAAGLLFGTAQADPEAPRLECARPSLIHLLRFEDGSAQLLCGRRLLVRISSPG